MAEDTLTVTDNRTGREYTLPITDGTIHATDLRQVSAEDGDGGLMSYGPNVPEMVRKAANYVDRILKGERPGDLPIEQPARLELIINLKTAKALNFEVPATLLALVDAVIE